MKNFFAECVVPDSELKVVIEEALGTCYAYLCRGETILGDVWLYNKPRARLSRIFDSMRSGRPPVNPPELGDQQVRPLSTTDRIRARFMDAARRNVGVWVNDDLWAVLWIGSQPGRSRHAICDGPVARQLVAEDHV